MSASDVPLKFGYNDWRIALTDAGGAPLSNAKIAFACSWMPAHFHGANPLEIDDLGEGRFEVKEQNLAMYGEWNVRYWVTTDPTKQAYQPQMGSDIRGGDVCSPRDSTLGTANIEFKVCVLRDQQP